MRLRALAEGDQATALPRRSGIELVKLATLPNFDCATRLHKARQMPKEDFKEGGLQEGGRAGTYRAGDGTWEIVYFKLYRSQIPVIERAIETATLMLEAIDPESTAWK